MDFNVYMGSKDGRVLDLSKKVVLELVKPFENQGHCLWFDNFYTSPSLMVDLIELRFSACGTCNPIRRHFPQTEITRLGIRRQ